MLEKLDNPGFKADRPGVDPLALAAIVIGFIIVLFVILQSL